MSVEFHRIKADFSVECFSRGGEKCHSYAAAAVAVAAFLVLVRGLPLFEMEIESSVATHTVFYTGEGKFCSVLPKCKLLYANNDLEFLGADLSAGLVSTPCGEVVILHTSDTELYSEQAAKGLAISLPRLPSAVVAASVSGDRIHTRRFSGFSAPTPDRLTLSAAVHQAFSSVRPDMQLVDLDLKFFGECFTLHAIPSSVLYL